MNPSCDAHPGHQVCWVPSSHDFPGRFPKELLVMATLTEQFFFWKQTVRGSVASEENNVLICFVGQMWRLYDKTFTSSRKLAREMDFPVECR